MQHNRSRSPSAPHPNSRWVRLQLVSRFLRRLPIPWARSALIRPGCHLQGLCLWLHQYRLPIHSPPHLGRRLQGYLLQVHQRRSLHDPMGRTYLYLVPLSQRSGLLYILAAEWVFFLAGKYEPQSLLSLPAPMRLRMSRLITKKHISGFSHANFQSVPGGYSAAVQAWENGVNEH